MHLLMFLALSGLGYSNKIEDNFGPNQELSFMLGAAFPGEEQVASIQSEDEDNKKAFFEKSENLKVTEIDIDDLEDIPQFSSSLGRFLNSARNQFVLEVRAVLISKSMQFCFKSAKSHKRIRKEWDELKNIPNLHFRVKKVVLQSEISPDLLENLGNGDQFVKNKTVLVWEKQGEHAVSVFKKLNQIFEITLFELDQFYDITSEMDSELLRLAEFQKLESVFLPIDSIPDEIVPKLKARSIFLGKLSSHPDVNPTVSQVFKQWYLKHRNISMFAVKAENGKDAAKTIELLLPEIPYSLVWSYENHENTIFSEFSKDHLSDIRDFRAVYLINRGDKKLLIYLMAESVGAMEVRDETTFLKKFLFHQESDYEWENVPKDDDYDDYY